MLIVVLTLGEAGHLIFRRGGIDTNKSAFVAGIKCETRMLSLGYLGFALGVVDILSL
jgi:hypothetical protein